MLNNLKSKYLNFYFTIIYAQASHNGQTYENCSASEQHNTQLQIYQHDYIYGVSTACVIVTCNVVKHKNFYHYFSPILLCSLKINLALSALTTPHQFTSAPEHRQKCFAIISFSYQSGASLETKTKTKKKEFGN